MTPFRQLPPLSDRLRRSEKPLVLLETGRFNEDEHTSYLFVDPIEEIVVTELAGVDDAVAAIERRSRECYVAGFLSYEMGAHFVGTPVRAPHPHVPLAWFGVFERATAFDHSADGPLPGRALFDADASVGSYDIEGLRFGIEREEYARRIAEIRELIAAGDTYQVNFTDKYSFRFDGDPYALYLDLKHRQGVSYNAFIRAAGAHVLSASPELFFRRSGEHMVTRPMKGTTARGRDVHDDAAVQTRLSRDDKNRSENVMIVDLMRNDLGRISVTGSVDAPALFDVERYETLFQMTSTVSSQLRDDISFGDILRALYPSGSVTGAPKRRTMGLISRLESAPRGVYTGAIGFVAPGGDAVFNVPIRTITIRDGAGEMGVGSGIVYDSDAQAEYDECLLKAAFLAHRPEAFSLIETMLASPSIKLLDRHMARLAASADYFGFRFEEAQARDAIAVAMEGLEETATHKVRLLLDRDGSVDVTCEPIESLPEKRTVGISEKRVSRDDVFRYHKTTQRELYRAEHAAFAARGYFDVIFLNEDAEVVEASMANVVIERDGKFYTPPIPCGLLPGVFRAHFLAGTPGAEERPLTLEDLRGADAVYLCNAVRGLVRVELE